MQQPHHMLPCVRLLVANQITPVWKLISKDRNPPCTAISQRCNIHISMDTLSQKVMCTKCYKIIVTMPHLNLYYSAYKLKYKRSN